MSRIVLLVLGTLLAAAGCATTAPTQLRDVGAGIVGVEQWGGTRPDPARMKAHAVTRITLHHQGVAWPPGRDPREYLRSLQAWSRGVRGWPDIPYHYVIDLEGRIYEGRPIEHAGDTNTAYDPSGHALVEIVGNFEEVEPNGAQLEAAVRVMSWLAWKHGLTETAVAAHRDYAPSTACPGANLYRYLENGWIRGQIRERLARQGP